MPNIIEQQDLLKGLTDSRLALLMQKPSGDIPPFLVAAEAARRQASREFSGKGSKESVVDSLTRQLANVPQNVNAPMKTPPNIPPPMQMPEQGIAGIPQQGMAAGGSVRRYAPGGFVSPTVDSLSRDAYIKREQLKAVGPNSKAGFLLRNPVVPKTEAQLAAEEVKAVTEGPFSGFYSPGTVYDTFKAAEEVAARTAEAEPGSDGSTTMDMSGIGALLPDKKLPGSEKSRDESSSTAGTSAENKYKSQEAAFRKRIEELYGTEEPSNWEDAQKWFAMSQAIMEPGQNLVQSLAGAGAIYAGAESEQAAQQREAERAREEMMLKYDMDIYSQDRAAASAAAAKADDRAFEMLKRGIPDANSLVTYYRETISALGKQLEDPMLPPERKKAIIDEINGYKAEVATLMNRGGGGQEITPGQIDSEMISSIFGK